jgi:curved DNA-binding protein CbpA
MTHYEELGLDPSASGEDIRKAHRTLSRLLDPGQYTDPGLRQLAEIQMRRMNAIVDDLLDPVRRRAYDESRRYHRQDALVVPVPEHPYPRPAPRHTVLNVLGVGIATAVLALIVIDLLSGDFTNWIGGPAPDFAVFAKSSTQNNPAPAEPDNPRQAADAAMLRSMIRSITRGSQQGPVEAVAAPSKSEPRPAPARSLTGLWFLPSSGRVTVEKDLARHAPRSIRMRIHSGNNLLFGEYVAEYASSDRPTQPQVVFTFQGPANGDSAVFNWNASDGSRGGIQLKLLSAQSMQVTWQVTEFGSSIGISGGAAIVDRTSH